LTSSSTINTRGGSTPGGGVAVFTSTPLAMKASSE
jgi:hypothetical protein